MSEECRFALLAAVLALAVPASSPADEGASASSSSCAVASADAPGDRVSPLPAPEAAAIGDAPQEWVRRGEERYQQGDFARAAALWRRS